MEYHVVSVDFVSFQEENWLMFSPPLPFTLYPHCCPGQTTQLPGLRWLLLT